MESGMSAIVECVPNFSEGRRPDVIEAIVGAARGVAGVQVLSVSSDTSHNRTVVTLVGPPQAVSEAAFRSIAVACKRINMDEHQGEHPRIGAADVVPFVPVRGISLDECADLARQLGKRVGEELGQPVYLYEAAAGRPDRVNLASVRRGEYEQWKAEVATNPGRRPDYGPAEPKSSGATVIGARPFLIAFNAYLNSSDVEVAQRIARRIRHLGGGLRYVKALGLLVEGHAQVSMNLTSFEKTPIFRVLEMIRREAERYGQAITHTEVVGLVPEAALVQSAQWYLQLHRFDPEQILEHHVGALPRKAPPDRAETFEKEPVEEAPAAAGLSPFLDSVADGTATPGGGSVAALAGALASALGAMVARLTIGRKKYAAVEDQMKDLAAQLDGHRAPLTSSVTEDSAAYQAVMTAFKMPKDSVEARKARLEALESATVRAGEVPLQVARTSLELLGLLETLARLANAKATTDAGVGAQMARAALEGAALNVLVNAADLRDTALAERWREEVATLRTEAGAAVSRIETLVMERGGFWSG
jgi:glutamate formiminotransferase/formiminotetrahydrofolate cyclodeaminase